MKIIKAKHLGFCYGVRRSIAMTEKEYVKPVCTYGEIIHNARIVSALEKRGIRAIHDLSEMDSGTLIIRSHGAPKEVLEEAAAKGLNVVDATCPFVDRTRRIVAEKYADGYTVAIFGKKNTPKWWDWRLCAITKPSFSSPTTYRKSSKTPKKRVWWPRQRLRRKNFPI